MSTLSLRFADSLHHTVRQLSKKDNISINQFVATAVAEKIAALMTVDYLEDRAKKGSRKKFLNALSRVRNVPPSEEDAMD